MSFHDRGVLFCLVHAATDMKWEWYAGGSYSILGTEGFTPAPRGRSRKAGWAAEERLDGWPLSCERPGL